MMNALESTSTRPYLIRALYEWCTDNGLTPYIAVLADDTVQVPREYVQNGEIVLNVSFDATSALKLGNEFVEFKARFGGVAREIIVPIDRIIAIYARESGQGMAFPVPVPAVADGGAEGAGDEAPAEEAEPAAAGRGPIQLVPQAGAGDEDAPTDPQPPKRKRPALKVVK
ncbi:ClpXP protease specificity-enhancing factor [Ottowia sp.]|uniref:ClpXP protease specificity-enhancing factor n=1 Tax=Ottowia sp. TaxID=1898956 RepID=UPI0039E2D719